MVQIREGEDWVCPKHRAHGLGYIKWHADADRRAKRGEEQVKCPECGGWIWSDLFYEPVTQQKATYDASEEGDDSTFTALRDTLDASLCERFNLRSLTRWPGDPIVPPRGDDSHARQERMEDIRD